MSKLVQKIQRYATAAKARQEASLHAIAAEVSDESRPLILAHIAAAVLHEQVTVAAAELTRAGATATVQRMLCTLTIATRTRSATVTHMLQDDHITLQFHDAPVAIVPVRAERWSPCGNLAEVREQAEVRAERIAAFLLGES